MAEFILNKDRVRVLSIEEELKESYLTYSMSVIVSRALPDVRDGLKPSQRRILVAMNDLNLGPRSKHRKCAKIAGDTSGNYHPHGEQVVYPTLVRMAQPFSMRYMMVDGQGNFGSIDGDSAAAMRYTEARMTEGAMFMLEDLDKETVNFVANYDNTREEPSILPSKFPNLLCNGASGIAVGMATNIPPHNVKEICEGVIKVIDDPEVSVEELMKIITGPDFPTGALICGKQGIRDGYETGRGKIIVRAKAQFEALKSGKTQIVITEIPYNFTKTRIIESIVESVKNEAVNCVSDVRDESDKEGMRLIIELKRGENPEVALNQLYKHTTLQATFSIIMLSLVDGKPETMPLKRMIHLFVKHREEVIRRRTRYLLARAEERVHILEGFRVAIDHIDEVISIIRASSDPVEAKIRLMERFAFTEVQAKAILDMRLQRLTGLEREKIDAEYNELMDKIREYNSILNDPAMVLDIIREDMYEIRDRFSDPRRTEIIEDVSEINIEDLIADEAVAVTITHEGYINRVPITVYRKQRRGGRGIIGMNAKEGDFVEKLYIANTHDYIMFFTDIGKVHIIKVYDIPEQDRTSKGRAIVNLLHMEGDEAITSSIPVREFDGRFLFMATRKGVVKKTELAAYGNQKKGGVNAIILDEGDRLIGVEITSGNDEVMLATRNGYAARFREADCRAMGRVTRGVGGIKLRKDDTVVSLVVVREGVTVLTVAEKGLGKRSSFADYRLTRRNSKGVLNMRATEKTGLVVGMLSVVDDDGLVIITKGGQLVRTSVGEMRTIGRVTQGVRVIRLDENDQVMSMAKVPFSKDEEAENGENGEGAENATDATAPATSDKVAGSNEVETDNEEVNPGKTKTKVAKDLDDDVDEEDSADEDSEENEEESDGKEPDDDQR